MAQQQENPPSRDILLPGNEYVLHLWMVRSGSAVRQGDTVATAIRKDSAPSRTEPAVATKHRRPTKRKRERPQEEQERNENASEVKNPSQNASQHVIPIVAPAAGMLRTGESSSEMKRHLQIGYIEPCQHPAIMEGLCAVCGESIVPKGQPQPLAISQPIPRNPVMSQVTVSGGFTMTVSETEAQQISVQNSKRLLDHKKLSLVLDLDHTLVHATADPRARAHYVARDDVRSLILQVPDEPWMPPWMQHYVKLRPHVKEFLLEAQPLYEISVYTAGTRSYAEHVTMLLSRCMVGSTRDDEDLQRLRHSVMHAEHVLGQASDARETKNETTDSQEPNLENGAETKTIGGNPSSVTTMDEDHLPAMITDGDPSPAKTSDSDQPPPKKQVTFLEPPAKSKTDETTPEQLEELKKELQEAEQLEQEALELRQRVFGSRIVSRTDVGDLGRDVKSLERIFPGGGSMAVIVDDREDVWANAKDKSKTKGEPPENLLLVRPYHWAPFTGFADVNNAAGVDISGEATHTADEADMQLLWTLDILKRLHKRLYSSEEKHHHKLTVPHMLRGMRQEVLEGCTLVLSGLVPLYHPNRASSFPRPGVVRYGESLGAMISDSVNDRITHVVAARDGTDKIQQARRVPGCVIVKVSWLMECVWTITRRETGPHLLGPASSLKAPPAVAQAPVAGSSSEDDEDDDLAAEFEAELME